MDGMLNTCHNKVNVSACTVACIVGTIEICRYTLDDQIHTNIVVRNKIQEIPTIGSEGSTTNAFKCRAVSH